MSIGLIALLDDVAAIAKMAAASLDDVATQTVKASTKAAGLVIDDAAVTPRYVVGLHPSRELPVIARIALGSLKNKLLALLPAALALSYFAPWAITPLLMAGGAYLCYEGAEKILSLLFAHGVEAQEKALQGGPSDGQPIDPRALEDRTVSGAVRTDFILSAEIMALTLAGLSDTDLYTRAIIMAAVGILMTALVYGVVALIVKADDIGLALAKTTSSGLRLLGRSLVRAMPVVLKLLAAVGTAAMLWVGGSILVHGLAALGLRHPEHLIDTAVERAAAGLGESEALVGWVTASALQALLALVVGAVLVGLMGYLVVPIRARFNSR